MADTYSRIYAVVRRIPLGKVASYGQVARLAGLPGRARQVGYAMHALPRGTAVPWQRVVNAMGGISRRRLPGAELSQRIALLQEGVRFDARGKIPERFFWRATTRRSARAGSGRAIPRRAVLPRSRPDRVER